MTRPAHRVLVLEDQIFFLNLLEMLLSSAGYEVHTARDGATALAAVTSFGPDLVILDIDVPGVNGLEVLKQLRLRYKKSRLPILMASARGEQSTIAEAASLGANAFLRKPYSIAQLIGRSSALLKPCEHELDEYLI